MSQLIDIKGVGPIEEEFKYEMKQPGLHVFRGGPGKGKTTILHTVQYVVDGKAPVTPTKTDGAKEGIAHVAGKTLKIMKRIIPDGDLDLEGLGARNIATLHWPDYRDAKTRDRYRIAELIALAEVPADASRFWELFGGREQFEEIVGADIGESGDLLEMAKRIKRAVDKRALDLEQKASAAAQRCAAFRSQAEGVDVEVEHDAETLQRELEAAIQAKSRMEELVHQMVAQKEAVNKAREALSDARSSYTGPSLEDAVDKYTKAKAIQDIRRQSVENLQAELAAAQRELESATVDCNFANAAVKAAGDHANAIQAWDQTIKEFESKQWPTPEEMAEPDQRLIKARAANEAGQKARAALEATAQAERYHAEHDEIEKNASRMRTIAKNVESVLSDAVEAIPNSPLRIHFDDNGDARLVLETDRSREEPFDELSDGERYKVILPIFCKPNKIIVLSQAAFGEISPSNARLIHEIAAESGTFIVTAQVDDGELRGEYYGDFIDEAA